MIFDKEVSDAAKKVFAEYDKNGDGAISKEEIKPLLDKISATLNLPKTTDENIQEGMKKLDLNKNGVLEFNEFFHFFREIYQAYE